MRILLLSRYGNLGASSRLRSYQYLQYLTTHGFEVITAPLFGDDYVTALYHGKVSIFSVIRSYLSRFKWILRAKTFDMVWVEKEMLPWLPSWIELSLLPSSVSLVTDYDDALFHKYDQHRWFIIRFILGKKIDHVMCRSNLVIVGNDYLANRARQAGAKLVEKISTVVDVSRYSAPAKELTPRTIIIGWIGTPNTARYLEILAPVLRKLVDGYYVRLVAVGANAGQLIDFPVEVRSWSETSEVNEIQQFDIGIMPLPDEPFERGKCGYKLIQYMACGKPIIASPVGVNSTIVQSGVNGFLASSMDEWETTLTILCNSAELRSALGAAGRKFVETHYSLQVTAPRLAQLLNSVKI